MPGSPEPVDLLPLLRRDLALEPDETALATKAARAPPAASRSGITAVSSSTASSTSMMPLRLGEQRRRAHVGRQNFAVAVEDSGRAVATASAALARRRQWLSGATANITSRPAMTA